MQLLAAAGSSENRLQDVVIGGKEWWFTQILPARTQDSLQSPRVTRQAASGRVRHIASLRDPGQESGSVEDPHGPTLL